MHLTEDNKCIKYSTMQAKSSLKALYFVAAIIDTKKSLAGGHKILPLIAYFFKWSLTSCLWETHVWYSSLLTIQIDRTKSTTSSFKHVTHAWDRAHGIKTNHKFCRRFFSIEFIPSQKYLHVFLAGRIKKISNEFLRLP